MTDARKPKAQTRLIRWLMPSWKEAPVYRAFHPTIGDHLYTTSEEKRRVGGYVEEGILCRVRTAPEAANTVPLQLWTRPKPADQAFAVTDARGNELGGAGYDAQDPLGHAYTAQRWFTIPLYELLPTPEQKDARHFYTTDREEALRAVKQEEYSRSRVLCHVLPPPIDPRLKMWIWVVVVAGGIVAGLAARFGDGHNVLQRLSSAWILVTGIVGVATYLLGLAIGKRPRV